MDTSKCIDGCLLVTGEENIELLSMLVIRCVPSGHMRHDISPTAVSQVDLLALAHALRCHTESA